MKVIAVTGVPGTGKTKIAKKLSKKMNYYYIDVNKLISIYKLPEGYDKKRKTKIIDIKKLNKILIEFIDFLKNYKNIKNAPMSKARSTKTITKEYIKKNIYNKSNKKIKGIIIDSHLSHYLPRKYVDFCIVTKCDIKELNKRLKIKKFHKDKIKENLQAEIFDICYNESIERKHNVLVVDTSKISGKFSGYSESKILKASKGFNINKVIGKVGG